jgi:beta-N-acetylhexosaminidase
MSNKLLFSVIVCFFANGLAAQSQTTNQTKEANWVDSVFSTLTNEQKIAQLMVVRLSAYDFTNKKPIYYDSLVTALVQQYNIGGICVFQGNPLKLAGIINSLQAKAATPLMVCIDAEWGLGMRLFDSVLALPKQMMLGAVQDSTLIYAYGKLVANQCKRLGIHVNYAPVVDVNNNPNNPVINDRSFGEDKYKVARYGIQYIKGLQDAGVMACAKHFPGHGDVAVDSHLDLPVINKTLEQLDSLEIYPFKQVFAAGVGSVMVAHLYIPSIDSTKNKATSISYNNVTNLMRNKLQYKGLTFTDALEMQGVKKFYPNGAASVQSIIAGNDMLCLPGDVAESINKIKEAINNNTISWLDIEYHCKRVLAAKYKYVLNNCGTINTTNITVDINEGIPTMKKQIAEQAITLLCRENDSIFNQSNQPTAYIAIGISADNAITKKIKKEVNADVFFFNYLQESTSISSTIELIKKRYNKVIIGLHNYNRAPAKNFGISAAAISFCKQLQQLPNSITIVFGNAYVVKNFCEAKNILVCYEDDEYTQDIAVDILLNKKPAKGKLPVTVCERFKFGSGITTTGFFLPQNNPQQ